MKLQITEPNGDTTEIDLGDVSLEEASNAARDLFEAHRVAAHDGAVEL